MTEEKHHDLAWRCAKALWSQDNASKALGMEIADMAPGKSQVTMRVRDDMVNGHLICHGGLIFTLADSAFAFACNSRNLCSLAMNCVIDYVRPAVLGDVLTAQAQEWSTTRSGGVFDVTVTRQDGKIIAHFRGRSATRGEPLIADPDSKDRNPNE